MARVGGFLLAGAPGARIGGALANAYDNRHNPANAYVDPSPSFYGNLPSGMTYSAPTSPTGGNWMNGYGAGQNPGNGLSGGSYSGGGYGQLGNIGNPNTGVMPPSSYSDPGMGGITTLDPSVLSQGIGLQNTIPDINRNIPAVNVAGGNSNGSGSTANPSGGSFLSGPSGALSGWGTTTGPTYGSYAAPGFGMGWGWGAASGHYDQL